MVGHPAPPEHAASGAAQRGFWGWRGPPPENPALGASAGSSVLAMAGADYHNMYPQPREMRIARDRRFLRVDPIGYIIAGQTNSRRISALLRIRGHADQLGASGGSLIHNQHSNGTTV